MCYTTLSTVCYSSASLVVCEDPTPTSGVTVVQPYRNAVNSEIVYQCEESGFTPSSNSSLCGEDEMWSPDPSQVVCRMMTTTPEGIVVRKWSYQYI